MVQAGAEIVWRLRLLVKEKQFIILVRIIKNIYRTFLGYFFVLSDANYIGFTVHPAVIFGYQKTGLSGAALFYRHENSNRALFVSGKIQYPSTDQCFGSP